MVPSPATPNAEPVHQTEARGEVTPKSLQTDTAERHIGKHAFECCLAPSDECPAPSDEFTQTVSGTTRMSGNDESSMGRTPSGERAQLPGWCRIQQPLPHEDIDFTPPQSSSQLMTYLTPHKGNLNQPNHSGSQLPASELPLSPKTLESSSSVKITLASPHDLCLGAGFVGVNQDAESDSVDLDDLDVDVRTECRKCVVFALAELGALVGFVITVFVLKANFEEPICPGDESVEKPEICGPCGSGTLWFPLGGELEKATNYQVRAVLYLFGLLWGFLGISIVCDQFMGAIDEITSTTYIQWVKGSGGVRHKITRPVWNSTVANLTLMALGSSAPEILLAVIELLGNKFYSGDLGPSTIVGSAAFNLFVITAVCICAIPEQKARRVEAVDVFAVTSFFSLLAYLWLLWVLKINSVDKVDVEEAICTLILFPVMVVLAYATDRGLLKWIWILCRRLPLAGLKKMPSQSSITGSMASLHRSPTIQAINKMIGNITAKQENKRNRAFYRQMLQTMLTRGRQKIVVSDTLTIGFSEPEVFVHETCGMARLPVVTNRLPRSPIEIKYCTCDMDAKAGVRYEHQEGILFFSEQTSQAFIDIPIIDSACWGPTEAFAVKLSLVRRQTIAKIRKFGDESSNVVATMASHRLSPHNMLAPKSPHHSGSSVSEKTVAVGHKNSKNSGSGLDSSHTMIYSSSTLKDLAEVMTDKAIVTIIHDHHPGNIVFRSPEVIVDKGSTKVFLVVIRVGGSAGDISVNYETRDGTAKQGEYYERVQGRLCFSDGQTAGQLILPILCSSPLGEDRSFECVLNDADTVGVQFGANEASEATCIVHLVAQRSCLAALHRKEFVDRRKLRIAMSAWYDQIIGAFYCGGGPEEQSVASVADWILHGFALCWKVSFAIVPPPSLCGGYPCFIVALSMTGLVTACVGDIAMLLGCCLGIPIDIAAITVVALGTSVPDLFASRVAAINEEAADNAIGNVNGSNAVNVFLGLGLPWTIGSLYWAMEGPTEEWQNHVHNGETYKDRWGHKYPDGGLLVPAGSLAFSVAVYSGMAVSCLLLLMFRRFIYGGELGGPKHAQWRDAGLCLFLWFGFIGASIANSASTQASK